MREQQLAFIRQECVEANPEIVALKFGCEVTNKAGHRVRIYAAHGNSIRTLDLDSGQGIKEQTTVSLREVHGRPIRLADVLLAVPHLKPRDHRNIVRGQAESAGNVGFVTVVCEWNLRKDDLTEQSDECVAFLYELLQ